MDKTNTVNQQRSSVDDVGKVCLFKNFTVNILTEREIGKTSECLSVTIWASNRPEITPNPPPPHQDFLIWFALIKICQLEAQNVHWSLKIAHKNCRPLLPSEFKIQVRFWKSDQYYHSIWKEISPPSSFLRFLSSLSRSFFLSRSLSRSRSRSFLSRSFLGWKICHNIRYLLHGGENVGQKTHMDFATWGTFSAKFAPFGALFHQICLILGTFSAKCALAGSLS